MPALRIQSMGYEPRSTDTLHGRFSLGIAQAKEMRLRELYLRNEP